MAKKPAADPRSKWISFGPDEENPDAINWNNIETGEIVSMPKGMHPLDARNVPAVVTPTASTVASSLGLDDDPPPDEESAVDRIMVALRGSDAAGAEVKIYRVRDDGKLGFCKTYTPEEFAEGGLDLLARQWGSGQFEVRMYGRRASDNRFSVLMRQRVLIEEIQEPAAPVGGDALAQLLARMDQRLAAIEQAPRVDPMAQIQQTVALISTMRSAFEPPAPPPATSPADMVRQMAETMALMRQMRDEIEPSPEPSDPLAASLPKLLDLVAAAQARPAESADAPLPSVVSPFAHPAPHAGLPAPAESAQNAPVQSFEEPDMSALAVAYLVSLAKANADVDEAADLVYSKAPDDLLALLKAAHWFDVVATQFPTIAPHRAWFTRLRDAVLTIEAEENGADDKAA